MPVQWFAPMAKDFPSFDCDAHVTEPPWLWERARDYLSKDEFDALKTNLKQFISIQFVKVYDQNGTTKDPDGRTDSAPACLQP